MMQVFQLGQALVEEDAIGTSTQHLQEWSPGFLVKMPFPVVQLVHPDLRNAMLRKSREGDYGSVET